MIGGTAYVAGKAGQRAAYRQQEEQDQEASQEQRIADLEAQQTQQYAPPPPQAAPPPAAAPATDVVAKLTELKQLLDAGVLTQDEFEAAKAKLLSS
jgi:Short C-terminal domain